MAKDVYAPSSSEFEQSHTSFSQKEQENNRKECSSSERKFDFVNELPEEVICPVCWGVKLEPYQLVECGHHLCKVCLDKIQAGDNLCPLCREEIKSSVRDRYFERNTINRLQVRCSEKRHGCDWEGELVGYQPHLQRCLLEKCTCKCGAQVQRCHLDEHEASLCLQRPFSCEYCGYSATFQEVTGQHWDKCEVFPLDCPNHCQVKKIVRADLQAHLNTVCARQEVACEFHHVGCRVKVLREALAQHLAENAQRHMALMSSSLMAKVAGLEETLLNKNVEQEQKQLEQTQKTSMEKEQLLTQKERIQQLENQLEQTNMQVQQKDIELQRMTEEVKAKEEQMKLKEEEMEEQLKKKESELRSTSTSLEQAINLLRLIEESRKLQSPHEEVKQKLCSSCRSMMVQKLASYSTQPMVEIHDSQDVLLNIAARNKEISALKTIHGQIRIAACPSCKSHLHVLGGKSCCIS